MTVFTENATPLESTKPRNSNSSAQIQIRAKSQFEFVPRDTEESEFLDLADFGSIIQDANRIIQDANRRASVSSQHAVGLDELCWYDSIRCCTVWQRPTGCLN